MNASRYHHIRLLITPEEMRGLFTALSPFKLINVSEVTKSPEVDQEVFLKAYEAYFAGNTDINRPLFSCALTRDESAVMMKQVPDGRTMSRIVKPVVQMRAHSYTVAAGKLLPMTFGNDAKAWGIQLSYPYLYEDMETGEVVDTLKSNTTNNDLFKTLRVWVRDQTSPATFEIEGKQVKTPLRQGALV